MLLALWRCFGVHRDDFWVITGKLDDESIRDDFWSVTGESDVEPMLSHNQLKVSKSCRDDNRDEISAEILT